MTIEEAEKAYMEQLDKSMGNMQRGDWYKRMTVRKAFRNGWKQALEQLEVNKCVIPVVMESDTEKYKTCTATECYYKGQCEDCGHYRYVSVP